jgi:hypothetical protein
MSKTDSVAQWTASACQLVAAAHESLKETIGSWKEARGTATQAKKDAQEAQERLNESIEAAEHKYGHEKAWPGDVTGAIGSLRADFQSACDKRELMARNRDRLNKQRGQLLERLTQRLDQAMGQLPFEGTEKAGWDAVELADLVGALQAAPFTDLEEHPIKTVRQFLDAGLGNRISLLVRSDKLAPSVIAHVGAAVLGHLRRRYQVDQWPAKLDEFFPGAKAAAPKAEEPSLLDVKAKPKDGAKADSEDRDLRDQTPLIQIIKIPEIVAKLEKAGYTTVAELARRDPPGRLTKIKGIKSEFEEGIEAALSQHRANRDGPKTGTPANITQPPPKLGDLVRVVDPADPEMWCICKAIKHTDDGTEVTVLETSEKWAKPEPGEITYVDFDSMSWSYHTPTPTPAPQEPKRKPLIPVTDKGPILPDGQPKRGRGRPKKTTEVPPAAATA